MKLCFWQKSIKLQSPSYLCKLISCATQEEIILNYNGVNKLDHDNRRSESYGSFKKNFVAIVRPCGKRKFRSHNRKDGQLSNPPNTAIRIH